MTDSLLSKEKKGETRMKDDLRIPLRTAVVGWLWKTILTHSFKG
jgi:hypothetical protein